mmetsp:Transcript_23788/g.77348  ORF Transcript_23788/g.77348 Transcript_23788/m.77348 type:complete len:236 (+) Transcript_23788:56-763(+)
MENTKEGWQEIVHQCECAHQNAVEGRQSSFLAFSRAAALRFAYASVRGLAFGGTVGSGVLVSRRGTPARSISSTSALVMPSALRMPSQLRRWGWDAWLRKGTRSGTPPLSRMTCRTSSSSARWRSAPAAANCASSIPGGSSSPAPFFFFPFFFFFLAGAAAAASAPPGPAHSTTSGSTAPSSTRRIIVLVCSSISSVESAPGAGSGGAAQPIPFAIESPSGSHDIRAACDANEHG